MALIDVTELLVDPDFTDTIPVTRRMRTVNSDGVSVDVAEQPVYVVGVIQPLSGDTLRQFPDLANVKSAFEIWTTAPVRTETDTTAGDLLFWRGNNYLVTHVFPWTNWGTGYTKAICELRDMSEKGPSA